MEAAILCIGDELMSGQVTDVNSAWISDRLLEIGVTARLHLSVGDTVEEIKDGLRVAGARCREVIVTGGLGPTADDLTREAFCEFASCGLVRNQSAVARLGEVFRMIGREMTANNLRQAFIPEGSTLIENPIGTAPGFFMEVGGVTYYFVPGVPRECELMVSQTVIPEIGKKSGGAAIFSALLRTFGMTESQLDQDLADVVLPEGVKLGYRAVFPEIHLKLVGRAATVAEARAAVAEAVSLVKARVGRVVYSEDGKSLEEVVVGLLADRGKKVAVAESCTGGLIAKRLTDVAGSSRVFGFGFVAYANRAKTEMLGVPAEVVERHGAVSSETAKAMARGALSRSGADLAVAVTGIAGPGGGGAEKPVGTVRIAVADDAGVWERGFMFARAERTFIRELSAQAALWAARLRLLGLPMPEA